jgi:hypothetical protein
MKNYSGYDRDSRSSVGVPESLDLPPAKIWCGNRPQEQALAMETPVEQPTQVQAPKTEWDEQLEWAIAEMATARAQLEASGMSDELAEDFNAIADSILQPIFESQRCDLLCIVTESIRKGEIKAANIQQNFHRKSWYRAFPKGGDRDAVRSLFCELAGMGIGQVFGEGNQLSYLLVPNDDRRLTAAQIEEADSELEQVEIESDKQNQGVSIDWLAKLEDRLQTIPNADAVDLARHFFEVTGKGLNTTEEVDQVAKLLSDRGKVKIA